MSPVPARNTPQAKTPVYSLWQYLCCIQMFSSSQLKFLFILSSLSPCLKLTDSFAKLLILELGLQVWMLCHRNFLLVYTASKMWVVYWRVYLCCLIFPNCKLRYKENNWICRVNKQAVHTELGSVKMIWKFPGVSVGFSYSWACFVSQSFNVGPVLWWRSCETENSGELCSVKWRRIIFDSFKIFHSPLCPLNRCSAGWGEWEQFLLPRALFIQR